MAFFSSAADRRGRLSYLADSAGMMMIFILLFCGCAIFVENFFSLVNMKGLALAVSMSGMVACTMLFCLAAGDFDLSIGSVVACAGVLAGVVINLSGSVVLGIVAGILLGGMVGAINGVVIAKFKINALITTLASMQVVRGLGYIISDGKAVGIRQEKFFLLGNSNWLGVPAPAWMTLACFLFLDFCYTTHHTAATRWRLVATLKPRGWPVYVSIVSRSSSSPCRV